MKLKVILILAVASTFIMLHAQSSWASGSGAFRLYGADAEAMGKGGAFVGEADNASAVYYNPAGLTQLKRNQASFGIYKVSIFSDHESLTGVETKARRKHLFIPNAYVTNDFGLERFNFGFGARANYGAGTDWAEDSFSRYVATKTELENTDYLITGAYELTDQLSFGVGFDIVNSKLSQNKMLTTGVGSDIQGQYKFEEVSWGYTLSTLYKLNDQHQFGLQYRSQIDADYKGELHLTGLHNSNAMAPLATVFGGNTYKTDIEWDTSLPQAIVAGYSFTPNEKWRFNFDVEWTDWSVLEDQDLDFTSETNATRLGILESNTRLDLDWTSSFAYTIGTEYAWRDDTRFRAGYFYHESPIPEANFNTFLPDATSHGASVGVGHDFNEDFTMDLSFVTAFFEDRKINNALGDNLGAGIDGTYEEIITAAYATVTYNFGGDKE